MKTKRIEITITVDVKADFDDDILFDKLFKISEKYQAAKGGLLNVTLDLIEGE
jgi:hypothetical protein